MALVLSKLPGSPSTSAAASASIVSIPRCRSTYTSVHQEHSFLPRWLDFNGAMVEPKEASYLQAQTGPAQHSGLRNILNVGHGVVQQTPEDNVKMFVELAKTLLVAV